MKSIMGCSDIYDANFQENPIYTVNNSPLVLTLQSNCSEYKEKELVAFYLAYASDFLFQADVFGDSILITALENNKYHFAKAILEKYPKLKNKENNEGETPLMLAIQKHNQPMLDFLVENEADVSNLFIFAVNYYYDLEKQKKTVSFESPISIEGKLNIIRNKKSYKVLSYLIRNPKIPKK